MCAGESVRTVVHGDARVLNMCAEWCMLCAESQCGQWCKSVGQSDPYRRLFSKIFAIVAIVLKK